jgi:hypothetical protein
MTSKFKNSYLNFILSALLVISLITFYGCGGGSDSSDDSSTDTTDTITSTYDPNALPPGTSFSYTDTDSTPTTITLMGSSIDVTGSDVTVDGNIATITASGTYNIIGTLTDGQVKVNVDTSTDTGDVRLVLNGVNMTSLTASPFDIESAERVIIVLTDSTSNYLTDGATNTSYDMDGDLIDSTLYSKDDLVICGGGSLIVDANYNNGIKSKDGLIIDSGTITVNSVDDGIIGKNYISVEDGTINVIAEGDGLKSTNDGDTTQGYIFVTDGVFNITAGADAIQVETHIVVEDGEFFLRTAGGSSNTTFNKDLYTAKGLKGPVGVTVFGGVFDIDSADDAIHSNDTIVIHGGEFDLASGDDAIHADLALTINNGVIDVSTCYEGIESLIITINDGDIHLLSTDDGINASEGLGRMVPTNNCYLYINGGYIFVNSGSDINSDGVIESGGDSIDSNSYIVMKGGVVIANGPIMSTMNNGALDYANTFSISGGFMIGAGSSAMSQAGSPSSTQCSLLLNLTSTQDAGTLFHIQSSDGTKEIVTFAPANQYNSISFSSSDLATGNYVYNIGGSYNGGTVTDGLYQGGTYSGGTDTSFTISGIVTTVGTTPGGGGGRGGLLP